MPAAHRQSLELLLPHGTRIIVVPHLAPAFVRRLWCAPVPANIGFYPTLFDAKIWGHRAREPSHFTTLVREIVRRIESKTGEPTGWDRDYIARKPHLTKKKLLNFHEIEAVARSRGFKIVFPEELSFIDQLRLVRHARYIVGPEGSGTYLAFFARPGTRVCALSPPYTLGLIDINAILAGVGVDFTIVTGREFPNEEFSPFWYDYEIQPDRFSAFLGDWLGNSQHPD
jgi:capsular polysaccharide biosynthesis protein